MSYYGLSHRYYARARSDYPYGQFPLGLGQTPSAICLDQSQNTIPCVSPDCTYGDCGSAAPQLTSGSLCLDQSQNQIDCSSPECTYGDCATKGPTSVQPAGAAGAPTGAVLQYSATWQIDLRHADPSGYLITSDTQIIQLVAQNIPGLQITAQHTDFSTLSSYVGLAQNLSVTLTLQVTGPGFASPQDAKAVVDHGYYAATGMMPINSAITLQSATWPTGTPLPGTLPAGTPPPASSGNSWLSSIFGSGAAGAGTSSSSSQMSQLMLPLLILFGILMIEK